MIKSCKCHGMSGSCTTKSCWMRINDFRAIGNYLKNSYKRAKKVESKNMERDEDLNHRPNFNKNYQHTDQVGSSFNSTDNKIVFNSLKEISKSRLIFSEDSPDYCVTNLSLGSPGTLGRHCSDRKGKDVSKEERKSCRKLCKQCGYKVKKFVKKANSRCNCTFQWCCKVKCSPCPPKLVPSCWQNE